VVRDFPALAASGLHSTGVAGSSFRLWDSASRVLVSRLATEEGAADFISKHLGR